MEESKKRRKHLRVPVFTDEENRIEEKAQQAGMSVARYLREVGQGYLIQSSMDYAKVRELAAINGDLGRLGGLLKMWLTDDARTAHFGITTIETLLRRIESNQRGMTEIMKGVVKPRAGLAAKKGTRA